MYAGDKLKAAEITAVFLLAACLMRMPAYAKLKPKKVNHSNISISNKNDISLNNNLKNAYLIKTEDNDLAIVAAKTEAQKVLETTKQYFANKYKLTQNKAYNIQFSKEVDIVKTKSESSKIMSIDAAERSLCSKGNCNYKYKILKGENLWDIANREHIDIEKILEMNPRAEKNLHSGDLINLYKYTYKVGLKWNEKEEHNERISYSVQSQKTDRLINGKVKVQSEGQYGLRHIVEVLTKVDGVDVKKEIIKNEVVKNPVPEKQLVGTSLTMPTFSSGVFSRPVLGSLSSGFGLRWGKHHDGVDLASEYGDNIRAADGGKVIYSGWEKGYGNFIEIDHENGYVSCYGHCSKLCVKLGQRVYAGEKIGEVGSTGHSTGPHLHFEVRKDGVPVNPWPFINKYY